MSVDFQENFWGRSLTQHEIVRMAQEMGLNEKKIQQASFWQCFGKEPCVSKEETSYFCHRCGNRERSQFAWIPAHAYGGTGQNRTYCLQCLNLGRMIEGECLYHLPQAALYPILQETPLEWRGQLSRQQAQISQDLVASLQESGPHLVQAVTGAGKTEMVFACIAKVLEKGGRVAIASPRLDVILELAPRLKAAFAKIDIETLYGGCRSVCPNAPLILATTHQLWRFKEAFQLLIVDEIDAFPYQGHEGLHFGVRKALASTGKLIYLTATPDQKLLAEVASGVITMSQLPARYHRQPLVEPRFVWIDEWRRSLARGKLSKRLDQLIEEFMQQVGPKLLFMPRIDLALQLETLLLSKYPEITMTSVHSQDPKRKEKVQGLRQGDYRLLITTTILERGVTFSNCQVLIVGAEDAIFTQAALVQIAGRVGRKAEYPSGYLAWAHNGQTKAMKQASRLILTMNQLARQRGLLD